jgi:hypothetical protein
MLDSLGFAFFSILLSCLYIWLQFCIVFKLNKIIIISIKILKECWIICNNNNSSLFGFIMTYVSYHIRKKKNKKGQIMIPNWFKKSKCLYTKIIILPLWSYNNNNNNNNNNNFIQPKNNTKLYSNTPYSYIHPIQNCASYIYIHSLKYLK